MDSHDGSDTGTDAIATFERNLRTLILDAFANGADIEGTWELTVPVEAAPDWAVEITKTSTAKNSDHDPEYITD